MVFLPVNFSYWQFALLVGINGFGTGLFASPNRARDDELASRRTRAVRRGGMIATFMNSASVLSIGVFFSLMVTGLASALPRTMFSGLTAQGVPAASAAQISHLPPIGVLFAAFLGYNPMQQLLGPSSLHTCRRRSRLPDRPAVLPGPDLRPVPRRHRASRSGSRSRLCVLGAIASALTGRPKQPQAAESLGAELAAVAGEGSFEPSELVVPDGVEDSSETANKPGRSS